MVTQDDFFDILVAAKLQRAARDEFALIPDTIDFDALEKSIELVCSKCNEGLESPPDYYKSYRPPIEKASLNKFSESQVAKLKRLLNRLREVGWFLQKYEQVVDYATDKIQWFFVREYQELEKKKMLGPEFYDRLLDRLKEVIAGDNTRLYGSVELLMLYFFYKCDIFKKNPDEISTH